MKIELKVLIIVATILFLFVKWLNWYYPNSKNSDAYNNVKCHAPHKCNDRYTKLCSTCKYNRYKGPKSYYKPGRKKCAETNIGTQSL